MNAPLDTDIRNALADILDTAPAIDSTPPSDVHVVASAETASPVRWLTVAAALVVVVAGLGWIAQRPSGVQPATSQPTAPVDESTGSTGTAVPAMLPSEMPAGWQLVDVDIHPAEEGTQQRGNIIALAENPGDASAVVSLDPTGTPADPDLPPLEFAQWNSSTQTLTWSSDGQRIVLATLGLEEEEARTLAASLVPTETTTGRSFTVPPASGFTVEDEYLVDGMSFPIPGWTELIVTDADGKASRISITPAIAVPDITLLLHAPHPPTATVEIGPSSGVAGLVRLVEGSIVTTYPTSETASPELRTIFDSIQPATAAMWASTRAAISDTIAAAPVIARSEALDVTVSLHKNQTVSGLCITRGDDIGCDWTATMSASGQFATTLAGPTGTIVFDDGSWYAVWVSPDGSPCPLDVEAEQAPVTIAEQVLIIIHPDAAATKVSCSIDPQTSQSTGHFSAIRPI